MRGFASHKPIAYRDSSSSMRSITAVRDSVPKARNFPNSKGADDGQSVAMLRLNAAWKADSSLLIFEG